MRWNLQPKSAISSDKQAWLQKLYEEGHISKKPESPAQELPPVRPYDDVMWVWDGFCFLNESRNTNEGGPQRINASDMLAYLKLTDRISAEDKQQFVRLIPELDRVYMEDFHKKRNAELKKLNKKHPSRN